MQEHHVAFVFAKLLELRLGHGFLRIHLQLGQQRVELSTDDLSLFMIRTMKAQRSRLPGRHCWKALGTRAPIKGIAAAGEILDVVADRREEFTLACHLATAPCIFCVGITCGLQFWASGR
jgi:hypothetical protein